jgi:hypothetical protein
VTELTASREKSGRPDGALQRADAKIIPAGAALKIPGTLATAQQTHGRVAIAPLVRARVAG